MPESVSTAIALVRICPSCRRSVLAPVAGGLGKMGRCARCGFTGPLRLEPKSDGGRDDD